MIVKLQLRMELLFVCLPIPCSFLSLSFLFFLLQKLELPQIGPKFNNIKQLEITVFPFDDDDNFGWIGYVMKAFPLLQKLELNVSNTISILF